MEIFRMKSIWAIASNTVKQSLRMKIAVVFIILLVVLLPVLGLVTSGDGTIKGRLQTFISYSLSLTSLLICLLTIVVSIYSVTSDLDTCQIHTVVTKPVRRFQVLLGKLLGVVLLGSFLLLFASVLIFFVTIYIPKSMGADESGLIRLKNEFFTARAGLAPTPVDVSDQVAQEMRNLQQKGQISPEMLSDKQTLQRIINEITLAKEQATRSAAPGQELIWQFKNVKIKSADSNPTFFVRFKYDVPVTRPDMEIYSRWAVGDDRQIKYGTPVKTRIAQFDRKDKIRTFYEIEVPAEVIADDGYLAVGFLNIANLNSSSVIFPREDGIEVLYKADDFVPNYIRSVFLIFFRMVFLACLGIFASTFLSMPVAVLLCLLVYVAGSASGFIMESFETLGENVGLLYSYTIKPIVSLLPQFDKYNPSQYLIDGRLLSWPFLAKAVLLIVCIKAVILLLIGILIFNRRELAKITV